MKNRILLFVVILGAVMILTSCNKENEVAKPVITIHELGDGDSHGNDHTAKIGGELHMDIDVVAEGKIDVIQVIIHPEGEHHEKDGHDEWEVDSIYTKFSGLKNTTFHEHIEVAATAEPGDYHFDFIVTDMEGNQSSAEAELEIIEE